MSDNGAYAESVEVRQQRIRARDERILTLHRQGAPNFVIAARCGVSRKLVYTVLKANGLQHVPPQTWG